MGNKTLHVPWRTRQKQCLQITIIRRHINLHGIQIGMAEIDIFAMTTHWHSRLLLAGLLLWASSRYGVERRGSGTSSPWSRELNFLPKPFRVGSRWRFRRVSICDYYGGVLLDTYVHPRWGDRLNEDAQSDIWSRKLIQDCRASKTGISYNHLCGGG